MTREHAIKEREAFNAFCEGNEIEERVEGAMFPQVAWYATVDPIWSSDRTHRLKPTPTMIQLGPEDVPPGSVFRLPEWPKEAHRTYWQVNKNQISWSPNSWLLWSHLQDDGWLISRDQGKTWERCEKEKA